MKNKKLFIFVMPLFLLSFLGTLFFLSFEKKTSEIVLDDDVDEWPLGENDKTISQEINIDEEFAKLTIDEVTDREVREKFEHEKDTLLQVVSKLRIGAAMKGCDWMLGPWEEAIIENNLFVYPFTPERLQGFIHDSASFDCLLYFFDETPLVASSAKLSFLEHALIIAKSRAEAQKLMKVVDKILEYNSNEGDDRYRSEIFTVQVGIIRQLKIYHDILPMQYYVSVAQRLIFLPDQRFDSITKTYLYELKQLFSKKIDFDLFYEDLLLKDEARNPEV